MKRSLKTSAISFAVGVSVLAPFALAIPAHAAMSATDIISKSDAAITKRITDLNALNTRVQGMKNQSQAELASITSVVNQNVSGLTTLKAKIDGETDLPTLKTDSSSIYGSFRIYALVIPRGWILAAADRETTVSGMLTNMSTALQTRITQAQTAGKDVSALQSALTDMNAKIADVQTQVQTAQNTVAPLVPDQGNTSVLASNTAALTSARAAVKTASQDLQAAAQDAKTITQGLK